MSVSGGTSSDKKKSSQEQGFTFDVRQDAGDLGFNSLTQALLPGFQDLLTPKNPLNEQGLTATQQSAFGPLLDSFFAGDSASAARRGRRSVKDLQGVQGSSTLKAINSVFPTIDGNLSFNESLDREKSKAGQDLAALFAGFSRGGTGEGSGQGSGFGFNFNIGKDGLDGAFEELETH